MAWGTFFSWCTYISYYILYYSSGFHIHIKKKKKTYIHIYVITSKIEERQIPQKQVQHQNHHFSISPWFSSPISLGPHGWRLRQQDRRPGYGRTHALGRPFVGDACGGCHAPSPGALGHLLRSRGVRTVSTMWGPLSYKLVYKPQ
jgi:hypothetical protein